MTPSHTPVKVVLAVGNRIYRDATRELLESYDNLSVEFAASNIADILVPINQFSIDLVLIDLSIPGSTEFMILSQKISPRLKFIVMAVGEDTAQMQKVHNLSGLLCCLLDDMPISYMIDKINSHFTSPDPQSKPKRIRLHARNETVAKPILLHPHKHLTKRQLKILALIESGYSNKEISRQLNIEPCTVKNHVHNILQRLQANNRCEAAAIFRRSMGIRQGLVVGV